MIWLITLPFRIVFGLFFGLLALPFALLAIPFALLFLPFLLLRVLIKTAMLALVLPFVLIVTFAATAFAFFAVGMALFAPLLPFAIVALVCWALFRPRFRAAI